MHGIPNDMPTPEDTHSITKRYTPETYTQEIFKIQLMQLGMFMQREAGIANMMVRNNKGLIRLKPGIRLIAA